MPGRAFTENLILFSRDSLTMRFDQLFVFGVFDAVVPFVGVFFGIILRDPP